MSIIDETNDVARILAGPALPSGVGIGPFDLSIERHGRDVYARETVPGVRFPARCPERHVMANGIFCLGREFNRLASPSGAATFWRRLGDYLVNQHYAERRRSWPPGRWLSHGNEAADAQLEAEGIAARAGWSDDYANALENRDGWIAHAARRGLGPPLVSVCKCDAQEVRSCRGRGGCPKRHTVESLIGAERRRRAAESAYMARLYAEGVRCCGRMNHCELRR